MEENDHCVIWGSFPEFYLSDSGNQRRFSFMVVGLWVWTQDVTYAAEVLTTQSRLSLICGSYRYGHFAFRCGGNLRDLRKQSAEANQTQTCRIRRRSGKFHITTLGLNARNIICMVVRTSWIWCLGAATLNSAVERADWYEGYVNTWTCALLQLVFDWITALLTAMQIPPSLGSVCCLHTSVHLRHE